MAPLNALELSNLTTSMFSAAMGNHSWEHFLKDLSKTCGGICTHIFGYDTEAGLTMDLLSQGYDPDFLKTHDDHFASLNAWAEGFAKQPAGVVVDCERMCPTEKLVKTEFYHDWLRPQENIILKDSEKLKPNWLAVVGQILPR